ncbi:hypothetical protein AVEN_143739-1 [Araneus ventricosus]|uniref:Transposase IS30-like HTH domain-containing protein n=1 Tax=Araneus ventricosus TaxID=182803 RepID=A0A4Y2ANU4_ARAVE|nr:hypothetical protein AVEN_143739-1 [Araneus ventricosus]
MGKAADLSKFDRGQIVMARRLGTSITETARLVGCSRSAVISIHAKWINVGDTSSRLQSVGRPLVIKEKGRRRLSRLVKQNWLQTVAQLTAQYNAGPSASVFGTHSSADTVGYGTVQLTFHLCASVDQASSSTTPTVGPGTLRLDHG